MLRRGNRDSRFFYSDLSRTVDRIIPRLSIVSDEIKIVKRVYSHFGKLSDMESAVYLLVSGVFLREYGDRAIRAPRPLLILLRVVSSIRKFASYTLLHWIAPPVDLAKAVLIPAIEAGAGGEKEHDEDVLLPRRLLVYLESIGDFDETARFIEPLLQHLSRMEEKSLFQFTVHLDRFVAHFEAVCDGTLSKYFPTLNEFHSEVLANRLPREDHILCGKSKREYWLNFVCAEIFSRLDEDAFKLSKKKSVLIPRCMIAPEMWCSRRRTSKGDTCVGCTEGCPAREASEWSIRKGARPVIIPSKRRAFRRFTTTRRHEGEGVLGICCAAHLLEGVLKARRLKHPFSFALLDFPGCRHWRKDVIPSTVYLKRISW